jgi:hypothetical protein
MIPAGTQTLPHPLVGFGQHVGHDKIGEKATRRCDQKSLVLTFNGN